MIAGKNRVIPHRIGEEVVVEGVSNAQGIEVEGKGGGGGGEGVSEDILTESWR